MMIRRVYYLELIIIIWTTYLCIGLWSFDITKSTIARSSIPLRRIHRSLAFALSTTLARRPVVCYQSTTTSRKNIQSSSDENDGKSPNIKSNEAIQHMAIFLTVRGGLLLLRLAQEKVIVKNDNKNNSNKNNIATTATTSQQTSESSIAGEDIIKNLNTSEPVTDNAIIGEESIHLVNDSDVETNNEHIMDELNQQEKVDIEVSSSLHKKEGDRIIALKDEFSPSDDLSKLVESVTTVPVVDYISESINSENNNATAAVTDAALLERQVATTSSSLITTTTEERNGKTDTESISQNYVPPIPEAISLGFGRSLPVEASGVVALRN